eukprot:4534809-Pyramimonas_sp.AAC.1
MHVSLKGAQGAAAGPLPGSPYHVTFVSPWVPVAPQDQNCHLALPDWLQLLPLSSTDAVVFNGKNPSQVRAPDWLALIQVRAPDWLSALVEGWSTDAQQPVGKTCRVNNGGVECTLAVIGTGGPVK